jgi:hypothetical protein
MDGYHVSHDPAHEFTTEPTTGRKLNILDVPGGKPGSTKSASSNGSKRDSKRMSMDVPKGRALSPSKIQHPKPEKPYASRQLRETDYQAPPTVDELSRRFADTGLDDETSYMSHSPPSSVGSSLSSRSSGSSPSSLSSLSDPATPVCRCDRYGITRKGERVKIDCGGSRCGYGDESSSGCSSDSDSDYHEVKPSRRQGVVVRR